MLHIRLKGIKTKTYKQKLIRALSVGGGGGGGERSGSVIECLTGDLGAAGSSLTGVIALCS